MCWHVLPALSSDIADQPWMLCLTGSGTLKCVYSALNKAETSPVSPTWVRWWGQNKEASVSSVKLSCQSILALPMPLKRLSPQKTGLQSGDWWCHTASSVGILKSPYVSLKGFSFLQWCQLASSVPRLRLSIDLFYWSHIQKCLKSNLI